MKMNQDVKDKDKTDISSVDFVIQTRVQFVLKVPV